MRLGFVTFGIAVLAGVVWYTSSSRVKQPELGHRFAPLLTVDGLQFKDLDRNGKLYEIKLDDYRALAVNSDGKLSLYSRRRKSFRCRINTSSTPCEILQKTPLSMDGTQIRGKQFVSSKSRICRASRGSVFCLRTMAARISAASPIQSSGWCSRSTLSNQGASQVASISTRAGLGSVA